MKNRAIGIGLVSVLFILLTAGCNNDILDPTQIGRFEPTPKVNVILDSLGVADEPSPVYEGAEEPRPEDLITHETDYVFGPGDVVQISIFELYQEGDLYINNYVVTETGRLSIPDVGIVQAEGLTEPQLEEEIKSILSPSILKNPSVTVALINSQKRFFSIVGQGIGQSGRYPLPRYPFRLTDAISLTGRIEEFNLSYIYVSRDVPITEAYPDRSGGIDRPEEQLPDDFDIRPVSPRSQPGAQQEELLEMITPSGGIVIHSAEMGDISELEALAAPAGIDPEDLPAPEKVSPQLPTARSDRTEPIEWVFEDGKWVPKPRSGQGTGSSRAVAGPELEEVTPPGYGLDDLGSTRTTTRVLQIPVDRLLAGDPRYNIVIRPGDRITVPLDIIGEFWIMGNVNAQGPFPLTGRPITLKQAVATAGGLNQIAWPKKVEIVRRLGKNSAGMLEEEIVLVDLDKIAKGLQPDFFIKPYDLINVGTHGTSRWLAVLRNAFRATYGFGFIYDRNFATSDFDGDPFPGHFGFNSIF